MGVFLEDLLAADFPFLRYALLMALLASVSVGATGAMASAQRVGYLVAAIAHASLAGIAAVLWLQETADWSALDPAAGALFAALGAAAIFAWMRRKRPENADALIGAVWSTG
ncbi:MAG: metal ABC transporter permease, partial [Opitutales bacterium]